MENDKEFTKEIDQEINDRISKAFRAVIDQQMAEHDPPETLETFERLQDEGFSSEDAYGLIAQVISMEVAEELAGTGQGIHMDRFVIGLGALPQPFTQPKKNKKAEKEG